MKLSAMCIILLLSSALASAQQPVMPAPASPGRCDDPTGSLARIADQWKAGYNSGDAAAVAALYTDDAYYLTQHFITGIVQGRAAIQAYVQNGVDAHYRVDSIDVLKLDCSGDFAYTITRYESTNAGQKAFGLNIVVLRKINGRWLIVAHEATVPDPATAIQKLNIKATE